MFESVVRPEHADFAVAKRPACVEVGDDPAAASAMIRRPNGVDTDDAFTDWAATGTLTPGAANPN